MVRVTYTERCQPPRQFERKPTSIKDLGKLVIRDMGKSKKQPSQKLHFKLVLSQLLPYSMN